METQIAIYNFTGMLVFSWTTNKNISFLGRQRIISRKVWGWGVTSPTTRSTQDQTDKIFIISSIMKCKYKQKGFLLGKHWKEFWAFRNINRPAQGLDRVSARRSEGEGSWWRGWCPRSAWTGCSGCSRAGSRAPSPSKENITKHFLNYNTNAMQYHDAGVKSWT